MKAEFMKGPWSFSPMRGTPGHCTLAQVWDNMGNNLCAIDSRYGEDTSTANAKLISIAPELLDALIDYVETSKLPGVLNTEYYEKLFTELINKATK